MVQSSRLTVPHPTRSSGEHVGCECSQHIVLHYQPALDSGASFLVRPHTCWLQYALSPAPDASIDDSAVSANAIP